MKKLILALTLLALFARRSDAQEILPVSEMFARNDNYSADLNIRQDQRIDSLVGRYILMNRKVYAENGYYGMNGYRIQIYNSSTRTAREESRKIRAEFMNKYPDLSSYILYSEPGYFKVRIGNFRNKAQATQVLRTINRDYRSAYIVPDLINLPELQRN